MTLSRRKAIALIAGGTILAAGTGFLSTRTPQKALAPWAAAGTYADPRKRALSYALLVPNPHNLQPWLVDLEGEDALSLYQDPDRRIPHTDPFDRQITIGLGCFIEQMTIAASLDGLRVDVTLFPDGPDSPVARAVFSDGGDPDPLAGAMLDRRSCKEPFAATPIEDAKVRELAAFATIYTDAPTVAALRELTVKAWMVEWETPRTREESIDLMRFGKAQINADPDGIALGGPFLESLMLAGALTREGQNDPASAAYKQGLEAYREMLLATPAYAVLTSPGNSRADQIATGARWLRLNLAATRAGLSLHPVSQCLQEYPEMAAQYGAVHDLLAAPGHTVQMLGRLGYGPQTPRTPRWPLEAKLRSS
ncbi:MAG: twin-arginine translocation pathway signal protein [Rhodobacteraceae bacterium]|nr:MAG: twin-arginine translocation pathway signal protein [Paracoccaceae bacterium]